MKHATTRTIILFLFILTTFYCYGARVMDYFAIYPPWYLVDAKDFAVFHTDQGNRIIALFVMPAALLTLANIAAIILPVPYISRKWFGLSLFVYAFDWILSFSIQIPIQLKLNKAKDMGLLEELMSSNWWRFTADSLQFVIVCVMFAKILQRVQRHTIS